MNAVTCVTWIKRGAAKSIPDTLELSEDELKKLLQPKSSNDNDDDDSTEEELNHDKIKKKKSDDSGTVRDRIVDDYDLDNYSSDEDNRNEALNMAGLTYHTSNNEDPYMDKEVEDEDLDDMTIHPSDNIIAVGKASSGQFTLEAWVYNEREGFLYCHHDYILPSCPLAVEWIGYDPGEGSSGNLIAVGSMASSIDLWDMDVVNTIDPAFTLAGEKSKKKSLKKKKSGNIAKGHTDAVISLSWNTSQKHVMASGSADSTIGIWDLNQGSCILLKDKHEDKVQSVQWHSIESSLLLSGACDKTVKLFDCRAPESVPQSWNLTGEVEKVHWNPHERYNFFASTDSGDVFYYDVRTANPIFTLSAHSSAVTGLATSPTIANCFVTSSEDRIVKFWDISKSSPSVITEKDCKIGSIFCVSSCPDSKLLFCVGGEREMKVLQLSNDEKVMAHIGTESTAAEKPTVSAESSNIERSKPIDKKLKKLKTKKSSAKKLKLKNPTK